MFRHREIHAIGTRLGDTEQGRESVGRRPPGVSRVDQNFLPLGNQRQLFEDVLERQLIERGRHADHGGHVVLSSPRR